jgi:16S rRNA processing protein RimM
VGRVAKAHGLGGEVVVELWTDRVERVAPGATLWAGGGARVLQVASSRPHQGRHLVRFEGVTDRPSAEALRGMALEAPALEDPSALWVHELVGAEVRAVDGRSFGVVVSVEANPASDLLVLDSGALIPLVFVVGHQPGERVTVDVPAGLLDL